MDDGYYWCKEKSRGPLNNFWEPCSVRRMQWGFELRFIGMEQSTNLNISDILDWDFRPLEPPD